MNLFLALSLATFPVAPPDDLAAGFETTPTVYPVGASIRNLSNGRLVTSDGAAVSLWTATGALIGPVGSFTSPGQTGVMAIDPTESFVLVGEAVSGDVWRMELDGSGQSYLTNIPFQADASFEDATNAIVSARACGAPDCPTVLISLNTVTGARSNFAAVDGAPGPVAFDDDDHLYYATVSDVVPQPAGSTSVVKFDESLFSVLPSEAYQANDGLVVIEIESVPPAGDWNEYTDHTGFTGDSYYRYGTDQIISFRPEAEFCITTSR